MPELAYARHRKVGTVPCPCIAVWSVLLLAALAFARPAEGAPVSIVDDAGHTVSLPAPAMRIIPLYAALGENLKAMGLEKRIIARTISDDTLPPELPAVGTHMRPNPELIASLKPDLVIQLEGRSEAGLAAQSLIRLGIPVARFRIASFKELFSCIQRLGILCGSEEEAAALIMAMQKRLESVKTDIPAEGPRPTVFFEVRYPNLLGAGGGSMLSDIIAAAGGANSLAAYPDRMVRLSEEMLVSINPDIYLVQRGPMNKDPSQPSSRPHFRSLRAVRRGFVHFVSETRFSRPGPQSLEAVEELAGIIRRWRENGTGNCGAGLENNPEKPHYLSPVKASPQPAH